MRALAILTIALLALSGCTSKDQMSQDEMAARADIALQQLPLDLAAGGALSGATLSIPVDAGFGIITIPMELQIGPAGDLLLSGEFGNPLAGAQVSAEIYCSAEQVVVVTSGASSVDPEVEDVSAVSRNPTGQCLEGDVDSLGAFAGFARLLDVGSLEAKQYKQIGKKHFEATFRDADSDLIVEVKGTQVLRLAAATADGELAAVMHYDDRQPIEVPEAADQLPIPVDWTGRAQNDGYQLTIHEGFDSLDNYAIRVYDRDASVPCTGGPAPVVTFDLAAGLSQTQAGFSITFVDSGDGMMGEGDWAWLEHPDVLERSWKYKVEVWDQWADASADPFCTVPGPSPAPLIGGVLLLGLVRRYW